METTHEVTRLLAEYVTVGEEFTAKSIFKLIPDNKKKDVTVSRIVAVVGYLTPDYFIVVSRGTYCVTNKGLSKIKDYIKSTALSIYREQSYMDSIFYAVLKPNVHYLIDDIKTQIDNAGLKSSLSGIRKALNKGMGVFIEKSDKYKYKYMLSENGANYLKPIDFEKITKSDLDVALILSVFKKDKPMNKGEILASLTDGHIYFNKSSHVNIGLKELVRSGNLELKGERYHKVSISLVDRVALSDFDKLLFCN